MATSSSLSVAALPFHRAAKPHKNSIRLCHLTLGTRSSIASASLSFSRRLFFLPTAASAIWDALTGGPQGSAREASLAVRRGMNLFREGDVSGSLIEFDRAIELDPRQKAYLWQRGLSLYYLNSYPFAPSQNTYPNLIIEQSKSLIERVRRGLRFEEGAAQFRLDVAANPNDTEESIWCYLCESQLFGVTEARKRFLEVGQDRRPVMREAYLMFKNGGDPKMLVSKFASGREDEFFYASLYAGLYCESLSDTNSAKLHIIKACNSLYGSRSDDYMASLAKVHCLCRNWSLS